MTHIFLSYSHKDAAYAETLHTHLERRNYQVWRDSKLLPGDTWKAGITKAITECKVLVVIMSPNSNVSKWVNREIDIAERFNKPTIPLLLEGDPFIGLTDIQHEDVTSRKLPSDKFYTKLDQLFNITVPTLSPEEKVERLLSLVDDSNRPMAFRGRDGVSDEVREQMRQRLIELAKEGKTIGYKQFGHEFGFRASHDPRYTIPGIIGNISVAESYQDRPLLSVLVVGQDSGIPGDGFYRLARLLKPEYNGVEDMKILADEMNAVFDYWQSHDETD